MAHQFFCGIVKAGWFWWGWVTLLKLRLKDSSVSNVIVPQLLLKPRVPALGLL